MACFSVGIYNFNTQFCGGSAWEEAHMSVLPSHGGFSSRFLLHLPEVLFTGKPKRGRLPYDDYFGRVSSHCAAECKVK
jgi:hypothetical protein